MRVFRLFRSRYEPWDPTGARLYGGRWNSPGIGLVYTSSSLALACLEVLVHLRDPHLVPKDYVWSCLDIVDADILPFPFSPEHPRFRPLIESPVLAREYGDSMWSLSGDDGMEVSSLLTPVKAFPSAIIPVEWNYLIHPDYAEDRWVHWTTPQRFEFDPRTINPALRR